MRSIFILILNVVLFGCNGTKDKIYYQHDPKWDIADDAYDNEIGKKVYPQLKKEKKLHVCESGYGLRGSKKIRCMHCSFQYFNPITLEEARELLMAASDLYLESINQNERIRPFLENYPFRSENIEVCIFLYNSNGSTPSPDRLQVISLVDGKLHYKIGELDSLGFWKVICEETYEEAKANMGKVNKSHSATL